MADAGDLYDEFGNYIGPELSESEEVSAPPGGLRLGLVRVARELPCRCCAGRNARANSVCAQD